MPIAEGQKAPNFALTDRSGRAYRLSSTVKDSDFTVLYFYPKDDTPGCTIEAKEFSKELSKFKRRKVQVLGISGGDDKSKEKFCKKHRLSVTLLSDSDFEVSKSYDAFGEKTFLGRKFNGILRKTYLVDGKQKIVKVFNSVKPQGHAEEVLAVIDKLRAEKAEPTRAAPKSTKSSSGKKSASARSAQRK